MCLVVSVSLEGIHYVFVCDGCQRKRSQLLLVEPPKSMTVSLIVKLQREG